jgi:phosphomannomutase
MVIQHKAVGGVIVTSSHNPVQWNGLKFVDSDGLFLGPHWCEKMFALAGDVSKLDFPRHDSARAAPVLKEHANAIQEHIDAILALPYIKPEAVAAKKYKVCLDAINGAGGVCMTRLLERFGCTVIGMNTEPSGMFSHEPEPLPENLKSLCERVKAEKADFGM